MKIFGFFAGLLVSREFGVGEACVQQEILEKVQVLESELSELEDAAEIFGSDLSSTVDFLKSWFKNSSFLNKNQPILNVGQNQLTEDCAFSNNQ